MKISVLSRTPEVLKLEGLLSEALLRVDSRAALAEGAMACVDGACLPLASSWLREKKGGGPFFVAAVTSQPLTMGMAAELVHAGTDDVFELRPTHLGADLEGLRAVLSRHATLESEVGEARRRPTLAGASRAWIRALREVATAGLGGIGAVLLVGETGTGKEGMARWLHSLWYGGEDRPWVVVDCAASVDSLWASEIFGHRKGAFTGAMQDHDGALARAHGGTLFLDEVGELRAGMQSALLRVLQERTYTPVGASASRSAEFRVVGATCRDLEQMVENGTFRRDLYERLAGAVCRMPPLRDRGEDAVELMGLFLRRQSGRDVVLDPRVKAFLLGHPCRGNVREIKGLAGAILARLADETTVRPLHLPRSLFVGPAAREEDEEWSGPPFRASLHRAVQAGVPLSDVLEATRNEMVRSAIDFAGGVSAHAANRLGVSERMVQLRRRSWGHSSEPGLAVEGNPGEEGGEPRLHAG